MKKIITLCTVGILAVSAHAATIRDNCGCGLGTMALGDQEPTILSQMAATFLNGLCGNQTFGITSGTLDCAPNSGLASNTRVREFIQDNMDHVAMDIAVGQGETLEALADLMEVSQQDRPDLYVKLQSNFDQIFTSSEVSSDDVMTNLEKVIQS